MNNLFLVSYVLLWLLVVLEAAMILLIYRQIGLVYLGGRGRANLGGIDPGKPAPDIELTEPGHTSVSFSWALRGLEATVAIFALPGCPMCQEISDSLLPLLERWRERFAFIWIEHEIPGQPTLRESVMGLDHVPYRVANSAVFEQLDVRASPFVYVIRADSIVLTRALVNGVEEIDDLITSVFGEDGGMRPVTRKSLIFSGERG